MNDASRAADQQASPHAVQMAMLTEQALLLRREGASYREIGERLGVSQATAHNYVTTALAELRATVAESADDLRTLEMQRLDALWLRFSAKLSRQVLQVPRDDGFMQPVPHPDEATGRMLLQIQAQRMELAGIGASARRSLFEPPPEPPPVALVDGREVLRSKLLTMSQRLARVSDSTVVDSAPAPSPSPNGNGTHPHE